MYCVALNNSVFNVLTGSRAFAAIIVTDGDRNTSVFFVHGAEVEGPKALVRLDSDIQGRITSCRSQ